MSTWNPWHGCHKLSEGCRHCYVYRMDEKHGKDSAAVTKTQNFNMPIQKNRKGVYKIPPGTLVYTCFTSDFFVEDADPWREEAWEMIRERSDLMFLMATKRIDRFSSCLPRDWGDGYENVVVCCTVENQDRADDRLPIFLEAPIRHKCVICEPLLEKVDLSPYLGGWIEQVIAGGESGLEARPCDYSWFTFLRAQCQKAGVSFHFKQTGARFIKEGKCYRIPRRFQHMQAAKAGIDLKQEKEHVK